MPDSFAFHQVDALWIDHATATSADFGDDFWREVLLGGTTVAGKPDDLAVLSRRLGLAPQEPVLLGGLAAADSPDAFASAQGKLTINQEISIELNGAKNPFVFSVNFARAMREQLVNFSGVYLGVFVLLQGLVIFIGIQRLRGPRRVLLWLVVPGFAVAYAVAGVVLAHIFVKARSDVRKTQVLLARDGWPRALLLTEIDELDLAARRTQVVAPVGSHSYVARGYLAGTLDGFIARETSDGTFLTLDTRAATRSRISLRSIVPLSPIGEVTSPTVVTPQSAFSAAWLWDGHHWRDLGAPRSGVPVNWQNRPIINPTTGMNDRFLAPGEVDESIPAVLKPLFYRKALDEIGAAGEGVFLSIAPATDITIDRSADAQFYSRRIVAWQFHLMGRNP